jgi:SAM-dependent methyltransferase
MENDEQVINGITMPPLYNKRAGHMWDIISQHVDFKGKRVVDLGCGYGDLSFRMAAAGAYVFACDKKEICDEVWKRKPDLDKGHMTIFPCDVEVDFFREILPAFNVPGVIVCCSVLPYLRNPGDLVDKMAHSAPVSIIECQYNGDGPGLIHIDNDGEMEWWLMQQSIGTSNGWSAVTPIGKTFVEGRDKWRTIWKCER